MPEKIKSSWADEVEENELGGGRPPLPAPTEVVTGDTKVVTEFKYNDDDKKIKIVRTYKVEKRIVSKNIAARKTWAKFGASAGDKPGPNPATTVVSEDIFMQFVTNKEEQDKLEEDSLDKLRNLGEKGVVKCRTCNGEHWTTKCPFKDTGYVPGGKPELGSLGPSAIGLDKGSLLGNQMDEKKTSSSKYIPPSLREGANKRGDSMQTQHKDINFAIRISNLSENTQEADLEELIKPFGPVQKIFLAKDKQTQLCKGFAYIHFKNKQDAANAIKALNGHGYDHLILNVDWSTSKPTNSQDK
ncbi:hypothetical protein RUM43_014169 [Polyplax serrata]|uniref:Eukaryotic translation initiation factor 3 subunit G n=1 Tax=Polyplax serrata TaxID=468196 RepID=A0AAN8S719_POLSC